ncbi:magnesium transporter CorA family protein [Lichenicoccus roseus]|nr:magnesium transporter CorA family protein [Lichenicoccus roseus]
MSEHIVARGKTCPLERLRMLYIHDGTSPPQLLSAGHHVASDAVWIDLVNPSDEERAAAERITGMRVPSLEEITEVESSSRVFSERGAAYFSMPGTFLGADGQAQATPISFVISPQRLITLRFEKLPAFAAFSARFERSGTTGSYEVFVGLLEAIVDRIADTLERIGADLLRQSKGTFRTGSAQATRNMRRTDQELRAILTAVGETGDALGTLRDSVVGIGRIASYAQQVGDAWTPPELKVRIQTLRQDIASLNDYDQQLSNKVNFLLDAVLGFINIEQNNGVRVLTIASVVGIPPTFVVGLYGMNFKNMPELNWAYGYEFGWAMIIVSIIVPLVWFRSRGWL